LCALKNVLKFADFVAAVDVASPIIVLNRYRSSSSGQFNLVV
jgi:hypothetical protein